MKNLPNLLRPSATLGVSILFLAGYPDARAADTQESDVQTSEATTLDTQDLDAESIQAETLEAGESDIEAIQPQTIAARVDAALQGAEIVPTYWIGANTFEGVTVQLRGMVQEEGERVRAEEVARAVEGVHHVINNIEVGDVQTQYGAPDEREEPVLRAYPAPRRFFDPTAAARPGSAPVF